MIDTLAVQLQQTVTDTENQLRVEEDDRPTQSVLLSRILARHPDKLQATVYQAIRKSLSTDKLDMRLGLLYLLGQWKPKAATTA